MTDIVERLRAAADEIEWLREELAENARIIGKSSEREAKLLGEIERLRAKTEWRPIETAPKDGTEVLITNPGPGTIVRLGSFLDERWRTTHFTVDEDDVTTAWLGGMEPTHWMPLPDAPEGD